MWEYIINIRKHLDKFSHHMKTYCRHVSNVCFVIFVDFNIDLACLASQWGTFRDFKPACDLLTLLGTVLGLEPPLNLKYLER